MGVVTKTISPVGLTIVGFFGFSFLLGFFLLRFEVAQWDAEYSLVPYLFQRVF